MISHPIPPVFDRHSKVLILGSFPSVSSIKNVIPNDLTKILDIAKIQMIFVNGKTAEKFYNKYIKDTIGRPAVCLPSTSPANTAWSVERLINAWKVIRDCSVPL